MKAHVHLPVGGINYTKYDTKYDLLKQVLFLQNRGATHRKAQYYIIDTTATWGHVSLGYCILIYRSKTYWKNKKDQSKWCSD